MSNKYLEKIAMHPELELVTMQDLERGNREAFKFATAPIHDMHPLPGREPVATPKPKGSGRIALIALGLAGLAGGGAAYNHHLKSKLEKTAKESLSKEEQRMVRNSALGGAVGGLLKGKHGAVTGGALGLLSGTNWGAKKRRELKKKYDK